jgi:DNA-directed RNA polymerase beta subunit
MGNIAIKELKLDKYSLFSDAETRLSEIVAIGFERNEIEAEIILQDEQIGDVISIETPEGIKTGIIKSLDICIQGSEVTAKATLIEKEAI